MHFHGVAVYPQMLISEALEVIVMQFCVADLVDQRPDSLLFAHTLLDDDALVRRAIVAMSVPGDVLTADRHGRNLFQCRHENVIALYPPRERPENIRQKLALGLAQIVC